MSYTLDDYRCPCKMKSTLKSIGEEEIVCTTCGKTYGFDKKNSVVRFEVQAENLNEYSIDKAAETHDNALQWLLEAHHVTEIEFRNDILNVLELKENDLVLITGVGAGNDLPFVCEKIGPNGKIFAQDISEQMLYAAVQRAKSKFDLGDYDINFSVGDAVELPFPDRMFDVVYHFGGINLFSDIKQGIQEMDRVAKDGGKVVFGDEGLATWLKKTEIGKMLITNNALYKYQVPLGSLPETARDVQVNWTINNCYYLVSFTSCSAPLHINIDLPHKGSRGGTIRSRHNGVLEGVSPELKQAIYEKAKQSGLSRVDYLTQVLTKAIGGGDN